MKRAYFGFMKKGAPGKQLPQMPCIVFVEPLLLHSALVRHHASLLQPVFLPHSISQEVPEERIQH